MSSNNQDPEVITESDIDWVAEIEVADAQAEEHRSEYDFDPRTGRFYYDDLRSGRRIY